MGFGSGGLADSGGSQRRISNGGFRPHGAGHRRNGSTNSISSIGSDRDLGDLAVHTSSATSVNSAAAAAALAEARPARPRPQKVVVAIDQAVPRRPPAMRARADAKEGPGRHCRVIRCSPRHIG